MVVDRFPAASPARARPVPPPPRRTIPLRSPLTSRTPTTKSAATTPSRIPRPASRRVSRGDITAAPTRPSPSLRRRPVPADDSASSTARRIPLSTDTNLPRASTLTRLRLPVQTRPEPSRLPQSSPRFLPDRGTPKFPNVASNPARVQLQASPYTRRTSGGSARTPVNRKLNLGETQQGRLSTSATSRLSSTKSRPKAYLADRNNISTTRRGSLSGKEPLDARREGLAARRESLAARREALIAGRETMPDRKDNLVLDRTDQGARNIPARRENFSARRDIPAIRDIPASRDTPASQQDTISTRREQLNARRDSLSARRDSLSARRGSLSARRNSSAARQDGLDARRDNLTARPENVAVQQDALNTRRESLDRRESGGRRTSSGSARVKTGMTALESFRAARRASLQSCDDDVKSTTDETFPLEVTVDDVKTEPPNDVPVLPDRMEPIVGGNFNARRPDRGVSTRFNDADINLENVAILRKSLGGRRSIGPNDEMPEEVPQLRRSSLGPYRDDGSLCMLVEEERSENVITNDIVAIEQEQTTLKRQRSPLRSIETNTEARVDIDSWPVKKPLQPEPLQRSTSFVPDIDDEKAGWPTDDEDIEDLGAW